ncbi:MAG: hypothetical protein WCW31_05815 [Patescibacteria group bacterium]
MNPKSFWSLLVLLGALILSVSATAEPKPQGRGHPCMTPVSQDIMGTMVILRQNCDLSVVINAFPQIDPATSKPFPVQVQRRSIYAANQAREEDGVSYPRSVIRHCLRPGHPDQHADADELSICPDGLMHYFAVAGAKILIPVDRELTAAEKQETKDRAAAAEQQKQEKEEKHDLALQAIQSEERAKSDQRIADLGSALAASNTRLYELEPDAQKGRWFYLLLASCCIFAIWGVGGTVSTVRARRNLKPVKVLGRNFADPYKAMMDLRDRYLGIRIENDLRCRQQATSSIEYKTEKEKLETRIAALEALHATDATLAKLLQEDVYKLRGEISQLNTLNGTLSMEKAQLEANVELQKEQISGLETARSGQVGQIRKLNRELEEKTQRVAELEASPDAQAPEERFAELFEERSRYKKERDTLAQYLQGFFDVLYGQEMPEGFQKKPSGFAELPIQKQVSLATEYLSRMLCMAYVGQKTAESLPPPNISSDVVPFGTGSSYSRLEPNLDTLQSQLAQAPSLFVVACTKICMREWAQRLRREGELAYKVETVTELNDLNAFVCSSTLLSADQDLMSLVGEADVSKIHLVSDWLCSGAGSGRALSLMPQASG